MKYKKNGLLTKDQQNLITLLKMNPIVIRCYPTKTGSSVSSESDKNWGAWGATGGLWIPAPTYKGQPDEELGAGCSRGGEWGRGQWSGGNSGVKSTFCLNLHELYVWIGDNGKYIVTFRWIIRPRLFRRRFQMMWARQEVTCRVPLRPQGYLSTATPARYVRLAALYKTKNRP